MSQLNNKILQKWSNALFPNMVCFDKRIMTLPNQNSRERFSNFKKMERGDEHAGKTRI